MSSRRPIPRALVAVVACVAIAAMPACGGGDSVDPQDFRAEANRVCRDVEQQLDRIQRTSPETADQAEKQAAALVDVSEQALDNLRRIEAPDELGAGYERYLDSREKAVGFIEDARVAAEDNDSDAYVQAKRRLAQQQPLRRQLALRVGLDSCSRVSVPAAAR